MADLFSSLGGLMKGLTGLMPSDDPESQLLKLKNEVDELKQQETDLYTEIGRKAVEQYGPEAFGDIADRLKLIQVNLEAAQEKWQTAKAEKEQRDAEEKAAQEQRAAAARAARMERTCPQCGTENPEGTKFCQECGSKLGAQNNCPACGHANPIRVKFCQECGNKMEAEPASGICPECGSENAPGTRFCGSCGTKLSV